MDFWISFANFFASAIRLTAPIAPIDMVTIGARKMDEACTDADSSASTSARVSVTRRLESLTTKPAL